jgi:hypothetical protein
MYKTVSITFNVQYRGDQAMSNLNPRKKNIRFFPPCSIDQLLNDIGPITIIEASIRIKLQYRG